MGGGEGSTELGTVTCAGRGRICRAGARIPGLTPEHREESAPCPGGGGQLQALAGAQAGVMRQGPWEGAREHGWAVLLATSAVRDPPGSVSTPGAEHGLGRGCGPPRPRGDGQTGQPAPGPHARRGARPATTPGGHRAAVPPPCLMRRRPRVTRTHADPQPWSQRRAGLLTRGESKAP